jgi:two-component system response regulator FixJ
MMIAGTLRSIFHLDPDKAKKLWTTLTRREREVAEKMAHDWSNKDIAESFGISPKTLDIHRTKVKQKLEAKTPAGIAKVFFLLQLSEPRE